jgi:putative ABC transport system permease protein
VTGELRTTSLVLGGVATFVLLMACANVANLLLARGVGRARELAVRAAIGGSRRQILQLLMTESALLAMLGGIAGLVVSWTAVRAAPSILPPGFLPEGIALRFDARVTLFAVALTGVTGVLFGLVPAWHVARTPLMQALASGGRGSTRSGAMVRKALAVGEVAGAVLLLSGAGLLVRTLLSMTTEDRGFHAESVLTMSVSLPLSRYPTQTQVLAFYRQLETALVALPGARVVGLGKDLPLDGWDIGQPVEIVGDPPTDPSSRRSAHYQMVSTHYFEALGITVLKGRAFNDRDLATGLPVCIVNEEFVRRHLNGREPLGMVVRVPSMAPGEPPTIPRQIVGVIKQVAIQAGETEKAVEIYVPLEQNAWYSTAIAIRTDGDPIALTQPARAAVARIDSDQPVTRVRTMDEIAAQSVLRPRFRAGLVGTFALLGLALAAVGIFGVLTFSVRERTREFGLRMALGARPSDILRLVLGGGAQIAGAGVAIGSVTAAALSRSLASLLYGVTPLDPVTFLAAPAILAVTAIAACVAPALHAVRADPAVTLREE